jgi:hypothetical protein
LPVYDSVVRKEVGAPKSYWIALNNDLRVKDKALYRQLLAIRDAAGIEDDISALRVFDIVTWSIGRGRRTSRDGK